MGRRKERRLAAMTAAGRRVKLDLFAEPSGDLNGSSTKEGAGGGGDTKSHAELPDSPSSSGKQPQNPLLLLEQYSDEESDKDSHEIQNDAITEDASTGMDELSKASVEKKPGLAEISGKDSMQEFEELLVDNTATSQSPLDKLQKENIREIDSNDTQSNIIKGLTKSAALDEHLLGDVNSGWKMVLDEGSNQYYYWNVTTGETSWEVHDVLAQQTVETSDEKVMRDTAGKVDAVLGTNQLSTPLGTVEDDFTTGQLIVHPKFNSETNGFVDSRTIEDGSNDGFINDAGTSLLGGHSLESYSDTDLSLQLIKHCESLLDRLNSVKGLDCYLEGKDLTSKCRLEIEIRLGDIKALAPYESCLLPLWLHSEAQLKRLEAAVDCIIQQVNPASHGGFDAALELRGGTADGAEIGSSETKTLFAKMESHDDGENTEKSILEAHNDGATTMEQAPYSSALPGNDLGENSEIAKPEKASEFNPKPASEINPKPSIHSVEDDDMDVDMEVDDAPSIRSPLAGASGAHYHISVETLDVQNTLSNQEPKVPGQVTVPPREEWVPPPPPDDEPFPPLPPDDEPFPPPPPDEPPETSYPQPSLSSVQSIHYSGDYALSYPNIGHEYYMQTNPEVSVSSLYTHSEGGQVAFPVVSHYYEGGPNVYPVAPALVNPVEPTPYYGLQNGILNPASLMHSTAESSGAVCLPASGETGGAGSFDSRPEAGSSLLTDNNLNVDKSVHSTETAPPEVLVATHSAATSSMANVAPVSSTSDATASVSSSAASAATAAAAAAAAMKPKVSRPKKRTVAVVSTLRSNKKVSSLVDKWKAAKEELQEDIEEPEDAYEILEKKRRREIEQWRANQIASGEAKDNANFQPLGVDWRERVKRRRAEKMKESRQSSPEVTADKQPDLIQLSKSLPSGWQAYWDESSKKVYYGNLVTSATSWTRPTE